MAHLADRAVLAAPPGTHQGMVSIYMMRLQIPRKNDDSPFSAPYSDKNAAFTSSRTASCWVTDIDTWHKTQINRVNSSPERKDTPLTPTPTRHLASRATCQYEPKTESGSARCRVRSTGEPTIVSCYSSYLEAHKPYLSPLSDSIRTGYSHLLGCSPREDEVRTSHNSGMRRSGRSFVTRRSSRASL